MHDALGMNRRRHFRLDCDWTVTASGVELNGETRRFEATVRNVSMSGLLLEAAVVANLWGDKPLTIDLPGGVGAVEAIVRRFLEYGTDGSGTTRWGVEFTELTVTQRAHLARLMFTEARHADTAATTGGAPRGDAGPVHASAAHAAIAARPTAVPVTDS
jgi:PilZ domain-containing protein